jgi:hypothetical protein
MNPVDVGIGIAIAIEVGPGIDRESSSILRPIG